MKTYSSTQSAITPSTQDTVLASASRFAWLAVLALLALAWTSPVRASDPVGIYAIIDKVAFEPDDKNPQRIQLWGAFSVAEGRGDRYRAPQRGFMYYTLDAKKPDACLKEWKDLQSVAGKPQVVGFGFRHENLGRVRKSDDAAKEPDTYPLQFGLQKIPDHMTGNPTVQALRALPRPAKEKSSAATKS